MPVRHAIVAPGHGQVRMAPAVFDADQQKGFVATWHAPALNTVWAG